MIIATLATLAFIIAQRGAFKEPDADACPARAREPIGRLLRQGMREIAPIERTLV